MGKIRRGNFVFVTYVGDRSPRHMHVYRDANLIVIWDLESSCDMEGKSTRKIRDLISELKAEGLL